MSGAGAGNTTGGSAWWGVAVRTDTAGGPLTGGGPALHAAIATAQNAAKTPLRLRLTRSLTTVGVFETDDVVELGGRHFHDVDVGHGDHAVDGAGRAMKRVSRAHAQNADVGAVTDLEIHFTAFDQERLVFSHMVLSRQFMAGLNVKNLPDVSFRFRPDELVSPRFAHASHRSLL
jgi:hypothetical protein